MLLTKWQFIRSIEAIENDLSSGRDDDGPAPFALLELLVELSDVDEDAVKEVIVDYIYRGKDYLLIADPLADNYRINTPEDLFDYIAIFMDKSGDIAYHIANNLAELKLDWLPENPGDIYEYIYQNLNEVRSKLLLDPDPKYMKNVRELDALKEKILKKEQPLFL